MRPTNLIPSRTTLTALLTAALMAASLPVAAMHREWTICNRTGEPVKVAIAHGADGTYVSRGWFQIAVCGCRKVLSQDIAARGAFLRTESASKSFDAEGREFLFCTGITSPFEIKGANNKAACVGRARLMQSYTMHDLEARRHTTNLTRRGSHCVD